MKIKKQCILIILIVIYQKTIICIDKKDDIQNNNYVNKDIDNNLLCSSKLSKIDLQVNNENNINKYISSNDYNNYKYSTDNNINILSDDKKSNENNSSVLSENFFELSTEFLDYILKQDEK